MIECAFGPLVYQDGVEFRLWAPFKDNVLVRVEGREPQRMECTSDGWHRCRISGAEPGVLYRFILPDGSEVPDPGSRHQPQDAHGPSEAIDLTRYKWETDEWSGCPWEQVILYELHVGSFTSEGTFRAAIEKLDHLADLGVTAMQIMPVSDFPGRYNWGYDGVLPYAPDSSYGGPEDFMALIDAAHAHGISVFLDVVYNHFGPDGNYLPSYVKLFTEHHKTPWDNGINYDDDGSGAVREFIIQNAIYWIREFRLDGLRLDAVHAIKDDSEEHFLHEISRRVRDAAGVRHVHLIVENEDNDSDLLKRDDDGQAVRFTAQWNDDVHHVLHIVATGETFGYYQDTQMILARSAKHLPKGSCFKANICPIAAAPAASPHAIYHLPPSSLLSKTMIRSAIEPSATE